MSARDYYHGSVRTALIRDGWEITHDPCRSGSSLRHLGAESPLAVERDGTKIAVEIKSFRGPSDIHDFEQALGRYVFYRALMEKHEPGRQLFLAIPENVFEMTFRRPITEIPLEKLQVALLVFDPLTEAVVRWIR